MYKSDKIQGTVNYDVWPIFGIIISKQLATLRDLHEHYTYDDAEILLDIALTDNYNQRIISINNG